MPIQKGSSRKVVSKNIATLMHEGMEPDQAQAIALDKQRQAKKRAKKLAAKAKDSRKADDGYLEKY